MVFKFDFKDGIDTSKLVGQLSLPTNNYVRNYYDKHPHSLMKGDILYYVHDFESLVIVDTQSLQLLHKIKTGIPKEVTDKYGYV